MITELAPLLLTDSALPVTVSWLTFASTDFLALTLVLAAG